MIKSFKLPRDAFYYSIIDQFHLAPLKERKVIDCQGCSLHHIIKINFAKLREKLINRKVLRAVKVEQVLFCRKNVKKKVFNSFPLQMFIHFFA